MVLDSSLYMTRAVFLSLLFHIMILIILAYFLSLRPSEAIRGSVKVYLGSSASGMTDSDDNSLEESQTKEYRQENVEHTGVMKEKTNPLAKDKAAEPDVFITADPSLPLQSEKSESVISESVIKSTVEPVLESIHISSNEISPAEQISDTAHGEAKVSMEGRELSETPSDSTEIGGSEDPVQTGSELIVDKGMDKGTLKNDAANLEWDGGAAYLRVLPDPNLSIPYNTMLPDLITITFRVQPDGTVRSIRILPPGSGHINLDQQIRAYVNSLIFDPFDDENEKSGLLRLNLRESGEGGI